MSDRASAQGADRLRLAVGLLAGFAVFAVALAALVFLRAGYDERYPVEFVDVALWQLGVWLPWVGFGLLVAELARLFPRASYPTALWLAWHLLAALGIASAHAFWYYPLSDAVSPYRGMIDTRYGVFAYFFLFWFLLDLALYGLLLGIAEARDYSRRYRSQVRHTVELERALARSDGGETVPGEAGPDLFLVRKGTRRHVVPAERIDWIEAQGYYAALHTAEGEFLIRESLSRLAERLDPVRFIRVHRSTIVNLEFIRSLEVSGDNAWSVALADGTLRRVSRSGRQRLARRLERSDGRRSWSPLSGSSNP